MKIRYGYGEGPTVDPRPQAARVQRSSAQAATGVVPRLKGSEPTKRVRKPKVVCRIQRCKNPPRIDGLCKKHVVQECDRLMSLQVRTLGHCESGRDEHNDMLQCAHGFSRSYKPVRWDRRNLFCLCQKCHTYYTHHPIEWDLWMLDRLGIELYGELRALALTHRTPDLDVVLADLRASA